GRGTITLALIAHRASLTALASTYPLRLISPRSHSTLGTHAAVYVLTFGGGVLSTDRLSLDVRVGRGCALSLHTQGNTKIFMPPPTTVGLDDGAGSGQTHTRGRRRQAPHQLLTCRIEPHALLCVLPDPTTLFAGASYTQHQTFHLANEDASLVLLDWYTSGRASRGEVWAWERFESRNEVLHSTLKETCILRDTWLLENTAASPKQQTTYASRMGHYHCFANLILIGSRTSQIRKRIEEEFAKIVIVTSGS
ncbi:UreD urease accessory protein-domain-containing protein, partial [Fimicolochytrium jonesii]|uniref:UreD urease accessory protein-domain-containing protein n=1 Tax=Fimicolochytrium jonesii TaxID=1396493 RepID=UPI0022FE717D